MEQLIKEIELFAQIVGMKPSTVLQRAGGFGGKAWARWVAGESACTMPMADRIRRYMASNWPEGSAMPMALQPYLPTSKDAA